MGRFGRKRAAGRLAAALIAVLLAPLALAADGAGGPHGSWELMRVERGGTTYEIVMTIEAERVRMTSRCSHGEDRVEVVVSSAAEIADGELRITGSDRAEKEHSPGYLSCKASISPATLAYRMENGKLVLEDPRRPEPVTLTRVER